MGGRRWGAISIGLAAGFVSSVSSAATQYNLVMLDTHGIGTGIADGISNGVAGGAVGNDAGIWLTPNHFTDLAPDGYRSSGVFGVSGDQRVGVAYDQQNQQHAMLWTGTAASATNLSPTPTTVCFATATDGSQQVGVIAGPTAALWTGTAASYVSLNPTNFLESTATGVANGTQVGYGRFIGGEVALAWHGSANNFTMLAKAGRWACRRTGSRSSESPRTAAGPPPCGPTPPPPASSACLRLTRSILS